MSTIRKKFRKCVHCAHHGKPGSAASGRWYSPGYLSRNSGTPGSVVTPRAASTRIAAAATAPTARSTTRLIHWPRVRDP